MALEVCLRFRCNTCGVAIEQLFLPEKLEIPTTVNLQVNVAPHGWTRNGDAWFCLEHEPRRVQPVTVMPRLSLAKKSTLN